MPRLIAIDLGGHSVKVTVWTGTTRRYALEERVSQPVLQDGASPPSLSMRLTALDQLLDAHPGWRNGANSLSIAWPGDLATLHRITLPFTDRAQVISTLPFTLEAEVPFDLDQMVLASRLTTREKGTEAFVAFARKQTLQDMLTNLAERRLDPRHIFVDGDLLGTFAPKDQWMAVIDVGHTHTIVSVCKDGVVHYCRTVSLAGRDFTAAIRTANECAWTEAEAIKHGEAEGKLDGLEATIRLLMAEVRSTLIAAEDVLGIEIAEARLTGGGARLSALAGNFQEDLGIPLKWLSDAEGQAIPLEFALADSVANRLAGLTPGEEIDLRVGDLAWRGGFDFLRGAVMYGIPLVAVLCLTLLVVSTYNYIALSRELSDIDQRVKTLVTTTLPDADPSVANSMMTAKSILDEKSKEMQARAEVLDRTDPNPPTLMMLKQLTEAFPPHPEITVDVGELTITADTVSFTAETDGYSSSSAVEEALHKDPEFKGATKGNEKKAREKVTFGVTIPLNATATGEEG